MFCPKNLTKRWHNCILNKLGALSNKINKEASRLPQLASRGGLLKQTFIAIDFFYERVIPSCALPLHPYKGGLMCHPLQGMG